MPTWAGYLLAFAAIVTAVSVIWTKAIKPVARLIASTDKMLPLLQSLTEVFKDTPHAFEILDEIVRQFRTDSGSSLRDVVNRLEDAAKLQQSATEKAANIADSLKVGVEAARLLAGLDRDKLQDMILLLDRLKTKVDTGIATGIRNENRAIGVAEDLAAAQKRADEVESGEAGAAADAAAVKPPNGLK